MIQAAACGAVAGLLLAFSMWLPSVDLPLLLANSIRDSELRPTQKGAILRPLLQSKTDVMRQSELLGACGRVHGGGCGRVWFDYPHLGLQVSRLHDAIQKVYVYDPDVLPEPVDVEAIKKLLRDL